MHGADERVLVRLDGKAYDLTTFYRNHPGGARVIERRNGQDISADVPKWHYESDAFRDVLARTLLAPQEGGADTASSSPREEGADPGGCPLFNAVQTANDIVLNHGGLAALFDPVNYYKPGDSAQQSSWFGLDLFGFRVWRSIWANTKVSDVCGPVLLLTDRNAVETVLSDLKITEDGRFAGNPSSDTISQMVGTRNIFHPSSVVEHAALRDVLIETFRSGHDDVVEAAMAPIIEAFLSQCNGTLTLPADSDRLAADLMIRLILGRTDDEALRKALFAVKQQFNASKTQTLLRKVFNQPFPQDHHFDVIAAAAASDPPPHNYNLCAVMRDRGYSPRYRAQMAQMLFMVGHNNLASALSFVLYRLARHTDWQMRLRADASLMKTFFAETMRLHPPVWLQARKVGADFDLDIDGTVTTVPKGTMILIPNLFLGDSDKQFDPDATKPSFLHHFSIGPNHCPGQYLAKPIVFQTALRLLRRYNGVSVVDDALCARAPKMIGAIALTMGEDVQIRLVMDSE